MRAISTCIYCESTSSLLCISIFACIRLLNITHYHLPGRYLWYKHINTLISWEQTGSNELILIPQSWQQIHLTNPLANGNAPIDLFAPIDPSTVNGFSGMYVQAGGDFGLGLPSRVNYMRWNRVQIAGLVSSWWVTAYVTNLYFLSQF